MPHRTCIADRRRVPPTTAAAGPRLRPVAVVRGPTLPSVSDAAPHIGTLREKHLHAALKRWYARPGDRIEVPVDRFVVDVVRDDLLIEVQTRGFSSMKPKVAALLESGWRLRIVHPIALNRWIVKVDADGSVLSRRRSPRHGTPTDVFGELVSFPDLLANPHLEIHLLLTNEEEYRRHTPGSAWRRKGWTVVERRLIDVVDTLMLSGVGDLADLIPSGLPEAFTTEDLSKALGSTRRTAQQMAYCLRSVDVIVPVGKIGNAIQYRAMMPGRD